MLPIRHLILGGARSGKTRAALEHASRLSDRLSWPVSYVATATALDDEMRERIARHREERPANWETIEAPTALAASIAGVSSPRVFVIDCLTLWLTNALLPDFDEAQPRGPLRQWNAERDAFLSLLTMHTGAIVIVSNEVGGGIVPMAPLARRFQDEQGWLNQSVARVCDRVSLVVAGIEIPIKGGIGD